MKGHSEADNMQIVRKRCRKIVVDFIHVYFGETPDSMHYRPPNAYQEVSNTNHFGSDADSLGRFVTASECMANSNK